MAAARQRADWLRVGVAVAEIVNRSGFRAGPPAVPLMIIPEPFRPTMEAAPEKSTEHLASESQRAWFVLDRFFGGPDKGTGG